MNDQLKNSWLLKNKSPMYKLCLSIAWLLLAFTPLFAQSGSQLNASFSCQNEKLSSVLTRLSTTNNVNFSYDANDPIYSELISYTSNEESTDIILNNILKKIGLAHKLIGNQIVLFHPVENSNAAQVETEEIANTESPDITETQEFISRYELDTIYIQDTILRIDTIRITDTVFIEKEKPEKQTPAKIKEIPVDFFQETNREEGWAGDFFITPVLSDFSLVKNDVSFSLRSFSLGLDVIKLVKRWNFSAGLRLSQFGQKFDQQYTSTTGGNYQTDTIDIYYTIIETDTSWYYVTDSSWVPLDSKEYNFEKSNTIGYLELNVSVTYDFYKSSDMRIFGRIGGQVGWLVYKNGIAIPDEENLEGISFSDLQFNTAYAVTLGAGLKYKVADRMDIMTELYYTRYFNQLVKEYEYDNKLNAIGLKMGLIYYF